MPEEATSLHSSIDKAPPEVMTALAACQELTPEEWTQFEGLLLQRREANSHQQANREPTRYIRPLGVTTISLATGGETSLVAVVKLRHSLAALSHPGESAASNAVVASGVLALGEASAMALLKEFEINAPVNAKENALRVLLLERWALSAPDQAARWIIGKGNGTHRS